MDRASDYGSEGWGFESLRARKFRQDTAVFRGMKFTVFPVRSHRPRAGLEGQFSLRCERSVEGFALRMPRVVAISEFMEAISSSLIGFRHETA
jgi:hypothetical protein